MSIQFMCGVLSHYQLLQHPEFPVYDLVNRVAITEFWDVIRLPLHK